MTKLKFYLHFFAIIFIFILPSLAAPFFSTEQQVLNFTRFSIWTSLCLLASLILFFEENSWREKQPLSEQKPGRGGGGKLKLVLASAQFFKTLGFLCITSAFFELLGVFFKMRANAQIIFPKTAMEFFFCALTLSAAAFYEEVMYRGYLPYALQKIFGENKNSSEKKMRRSEIAAEIVAILFFAFAHAQNGVLAISNAIFAGAALRRCALKTGGVMTGFTAHLVFNVLVLVSS